MTPVMPTPVEFTERLKRKVCTFCESSVINVLGSEKTPSK